MALSIRCLTDTSIEVNKLRKDVTFVHGNYAGPPPYVRFVVILIKKIIIIIPSS